MSTPFRLPMLRFKDERKQRGAVLRVMSLALMMVVAGVASLNVALPELARDTGATQTELQWIVDAYALVFAALLLPAGAIGDRYGRKPLLVGGLVLFGVASSVALFVDSPPELIAVRATLGVAAAMVMPVTLSVITTIFPPEERGKAVGTWAGVAAGGAVIGLLASGVLLEWFSWQSIFILNVVMAAGALAATVVIVPQTRDEHPPRLDPVGTLFSMIGLAGIVFGTIEGPERGWTDALTVAGLGGGLVSLVAFVAWELRLEEPMLDPRHFLNKAFSAGSLSIFVQFFAAFGFLFLALPYLQLVLDYSPLQASAALAPMAIVVIPLSRLAPSVSVHLGPRVTGATGLGLIATSFLVVAGLDAGSSYWEFLLAIIPFGAGMALSGAPATGVIVGSLPPEKQGVASAVNDVSRELGGALGIAVLGSVMNDAYRSGMTDTAANLPPDAVEPATSSLAAAIAIGERLGVDGQALIAQAQSAFVDGLGKSMIVGASALIVGGLFVVLRAPGRSRQPQQATTPLATGASSPDVADVPSAAASSSSHGLAEQPAPSGGGG